MTAAFEMDPFNDHESQLSIALFTADDNLLEATRIDLQPRMRIYHLDHTVVVLGRGSKPSVELDLLACTADSVPLLRRHGGGCAVVVDPGNLIVSVVIPAPGLSGSLRYFEKLSVWIAAALHRMGVKNIHREGSSDLVLGDRKIGGACIYRAKNLLYYSTTLLIHPDIALMERYLRHPPREPAYRRGRPHAEFVQPLGPLLPSLALDVITADLRQELQLSNLDLE